MEVFRARCFGEEGRNVGGSVSGGRLLAEVFIAGCWGEEGRDVKVLMDHLVDES